MNKKSPKCEHFEECRAKDDCKESGKCRGQDIKDWCHWDGKLELKREAIEKWSQLQRENKKVFCNDGHTEPLVIKPKEWKQAPKLCDAYITCPMPQRCEEAGECRASVVNAPACKEKESCSNCRFSKDLRGPKFNRSICRKNPPIIDPGDYVEGWPREANFFPFTQEWCGQWEPKR